MHIVQLGPTLRAGPNGAAAKPLFALPRNGALRGLTAVSTRLAPLAGQTAAPLCWLVIL